MGFLVVLRKTVTATGEKEANLLERKNEADGRMEIPAFGFEVKVTTQSASRGA